jgi:hypothetical protein
VGREQGEGAREEQVAHRDRPLGPGAGCHGGDAAAQGRVVEDVVVDQGRHVYKLDRGGGAHRLLSPLGSGAKQHEQRAQALAAGGERGLRVAGKQVAKAAALRPQQLLDLAQPRRQPATRGVEHRGDGGWYGGGPGHPRRPLWIAMIPPARTVQPMRSMPASCISPASRLGLGKLRTDSGR